MGKSNYPPCLGCLNRHIGCHGECKRYKEYIEVDRAEKKAREKFLREENEVIETHKRRRRLNE